MFFLSAPWGCGVLCDEGQMCGVFRFSLWIGAGVSTPLCKLVKQSGWVGLQKLSTPPFSASAGV
jgi:hypothetical protein